MTNDVGTFNGGKSNRKVGCIPELAEVRSAEENWTGLTDPAIRRKMQNRLNQRIYRRRRAKPAESNSVPDRSVSITQSSISTTDQHERNEEADSNVPTTNNIRQRNALSSDLSIQARTPKSIHQMDRAEILQTMAHYEASARQNYALGSPRADQLLTLIQFNVFRALVDNTSTISFNMDWLDEDAISPWCEGASETQISLCPHSLRPTALQQEISHHPWIDLFPFPQMRDNLLRRYEDEEFDESALCNDLVDFYEVSNEETGLIVWREPWQPAGWEVSETFLCRWKWVVQGCDDLVKSTNYWRGIRGEDPLVFGT